MYSNKNGMKEIVQGVDYFRFQPGESELSSSLQQQPVSEPHQEQGFKANNKLILKGYTLSSKGFVLKNLSWSKHAQFTHRIECDRTQNGD